MEANHNNSSKLLVPLQALPLIPRQAYYRQRQLFTDFMPLLDLRKKQVKDENQNGIRRNREETEIKPEVKKEEESGQHIENKNNFQLASASTSSEKHQVGSTVAVCSDSSTWWLADACPQLDNEMSELRKYRLQLVPQIVRNNDQNFLQNNNNSNNHFTNGSRLSMSSVAKIQLERFENLSQSDSRFCGRDFFLSDSSASSSRKKANNNFSLNGFFEPNAESTVLNCRWVLEPAGLVLADSDWLRLQDGPDDILVGSSAGPRAKSKHLPIAKFAHARWAKLLSVLKQQRENGGEDEKSNDDASTNKKKKTKIVRSQNKKNIDQKQQSDEKTFMKKVKKQSKKKKRIIDNKKLFSKSTPPLRKSPLWSCEVYCYVTSPLSTHGAHWVTLRTLIRSCDPQKNRNLLISAAREVDNLASELVRRKLVMGIELLRVGATTVTSPEPAEVARREALWAWYACAPHDGVSLLFQEAEGIKRILMNVKEEKNKTFPFYSETDVLKKESVMWHLLANFWNVPLDLLQGSVKVAEAGNERCATIAAVILKSRSLGRTMTSSELYHFPTRQL